MKQMKKYLAGIVILFLCLLLGYGTTKKDDTAAISSTVTDATTTESSSSKAKNSSSKAKNSSSKAEDTLKVKESTEYTTKEEVALYIHEFGHLPNNFITKKEAKKLGWVSKKGNLEDVAPGKSIGGDHFGNYEGQLPEKKGRTYQECDINADGGYRGAFRVIFSNDGLVYYTEDHYETFELLYGEE